MTILEINTRGTFSDIEVRIRGDQATSGVVEIRENTSDVWGTVCADFWDNADATVVCRMLGYKWGIGRTVIYHIVTLCKEYTREMLYLHYLNKVGAVGLKAKQ